MWDPSVLPPFCLPALLFASTAQLLQHSGDLILTSTHLFPILLDQHINLLCLLRFSSLLLWFSVRKEVERRLWERKFGAGSRNILRLGGVSSPLACRKEVRWGWAVDVGASLLKKDKSSEWEGMCILELDSRYSRRGARKNTYAPDMVSDMPAVVTFILAVLPLCFQLQQVPLGI